MPTMHPHGPTDGLISPDGSVRVPPALISPLCAVLGRYLAGCARDGAGGAPTPAVRALYWALRDAENRPATRPGSAIGTPPPPPCTLELSTTEVARLLGASSGYVRRLCRTGRVSARRVGRAWLIDQASLDAWRHGNREAP
ncbi:helix-turn-helix domain-containing protein [Actinoplanes sp. NPDC051494]|uniref:helix-turn-helix domain-containing protein n=1 Tax=Actinoplanes sp. NPDC051494 TaxID=3363907 RepID=UPI0037914D19